ncbi:hypothetical protein E8E15_003596 [Penicillium rubens]|nr:hypothetical protein E8E15_003596 [Penicillium rubens]
MEMSDALCYLRLRLGHLKQTPEQSQPNATPSGSTPLPFIVFYTFSISGSYNAASAEGSSVASSGFFSAATKAETLRIAGGKC